MEDISCITRTAEICKTSQGFIRIKIIPGSVIDEGDALDNLVVIKNISAGEKYLKLLDFTGDWSMTAEAKKISQKNSSPENTIARAYITDSYFAKLMHDFFDSLSMPELPQKFFTNENEAIEWLLSKK